MRRRPHRHPALEAAVFAAALLLAVFIARELWARRAPAPSTPEPVAMEPLILRPSRPPLPSASSRPRTETAVAGVASIKLTRVERRKPKPAAVPVPR